MTVHLRELKIKDAPLMLEWIKDPQINRFFRFDAFSMNLHDCINYIESADSDPRTIHFAIVDDNDEYLGTISLKNIENGEAEYAISTRRAVHGTGAALEATRQILRYAFEELGLNRVYLNVLVDNLRANAFYRKAGFVFWFKEEKAVVINDISRDLNWYYLDKRQFITA